MAGLKRVRVLGITAALSLVVHGAALAWVVTRPKPEPVVMVSEQQAKVTVEDPITEVVLLPDDPATPQPVPETVAAPVRVEPAPRVARPGTPTRAAIVASASTATPGAETAPPVTGTPAAPEPPATGTPGKKPSILDMRTGPQIERTIDKLANEVADHPIDYGPLPDYPGLRDRQALEVAKATHDLAGIVAAREAIAAEELEPNKDGTFTANHTTYTAKVERDGTVHFKDKANWQQKGLFFATFDGTDAIMRAAGMDPYASEKLAMLDRTRDQRVEIAKEYRKELLSHSSQLMQANLERLWAMTQDVAARKQGVFDLWEDCAETGEPEVVAGAEEARALLARFVQVHLKGSDAFTADDLARLNAKRRSKASFDPYH